MKCQLLKYLLLCALLQAVLCKSFSQTATDTAQTKRVDTLVKNITEIKEAIRKTDSALTIIAKDAVKRTKDSAVNSDSISLFNAWQYAKAHPKETIYAMLCEKCDRNWIITIAVIIFLLFFWYKALYYFIHSALCRDESYLSPGVLRPYNERPYSYSRVQMFWWTMIIITCYGIFYALYGRLIPLNPTCIILLGGSLAVQIFGKTIDSSQKEKDKAINNGLANRHQDLEPHKDLLTDILSDDNGISMHRLQSVAFNIIYGLGFIGYFITSIACKAYPFVDFEAWQFTLLGISAGGYLGLKTSENGKASEAERTRQAQLNNENAANN
jgi:hypothetical protein